MPEATLPLRPLTTGELLDAAVALLRAPGWRLVGFGALAALLEQVVLFPLRRAADLDISYLPGTGLWPQFWLMVTVGFGTEALAIALLGATAAAAAPRALLGRAAPARVGRGRGGAVVVAAPFVAALCAAPWLLTAVTARAEGNTFRGWTALAVLFALFVWIFLYGLQALVVPAVVIDRLGPGRALIRSVQLASRTGMRVVWLRLLAYIAWFFIRTALGLAVVAAIEYLFPSPSTLVDVVFLSIAWLLVNVVAYPVLACLDAVLHLETRMRTEGLDIALRRAASKGVAIDSALAVPGRAG